MKKCPYCVKEIQDEAIKCKHCGEWLKKDIQGLPLQTDEVKKIIPLEGKPQFVDVSPEIDEEIKKKEAGLKQCPICGKWDAYKKYLDYWCPHCKKSIFEPINASMGSMLRNLKNKVNRLKEVWGGDQKSAMVIVEAGQTKEEALRQHLQKNPQDRGCHIIVYFYKP